MNFHFYKIMYNTNYTLPNSVSGLAGSATISRATGGKFASGGNSDTYNVLGVDKVENVNSNMDYVSRAIGGIGGLLQVGTGMMLVGSIYGSILGAALIAHGANNIEEAIYGNGHRGVLRSSVYDNIFGSNSNYAYAVGDVGLSAFSMLRQVGIKSAQYWSRSFGNVESTRVVYGYQTNIYATGFEFVNNYITISGTEGN